MEVIKELPEVFEEFAEQRKNSFLAMKQLKDKGIPVVGAYLSLIHISKDELFSEIWDMESIGDIATVTVHIKKIREKIEYDTSKPQYIETIWGVGYRFKV